MRAAMSNTNRRLGTLPSSYTQAISTALKSVGFDLNDPRPLAAAVQKLSDYYIENPQASTPWSQAWAQAASLAYYFPLNYARNRQVALEAQRLGFFSDLSSSLDFGSGTGAALFSFADQWPAGADFPEAWACDQSAIPLELAFSLSSASRLKNYVKFVPPSSEGEPSFDPRLEKSRALLTASYVFTELDAIPSWWLGFEALAVIEPSTQADGRRLMELRATLLEHGFHIWAPCTHGDACPMLQHSKRDWCHDRIHWQAPEWFERLERELPMKNRTLTFSYLLARRRVAPPASLKKMARLTGDMLIEKGKTRQSVCRDTNRSFLSWFPQRLPKGSSINLERGNLVRLGPGLEERASELRAAESNMIEEVPPDQAPLE